VFRKHDGILPVDLQDRERVCVCVLLIKQLKLLLISEAIWEVMRSEMALVAEIYRDLRHILDVMAL